jgi:DNA-binding transcriptional LysR family regulator
MRWSRTRNAKEATEPSQRILSGIPLISLRQAVVVAEVLNFRHAANVLGVTQSSVSARIKMLEDALGILLFERRHRGVRLTEAGRQFVAEVSVGIEKLDHALRTAGAISHCVDGQISIGLHSSLIGGFLADLRRRFRTGYPTIEQLIIEGRSSETIALVRDGKLDVAFVAGAAQAPDCHTRQLWSEPMVIALPEDHRLADRKSLVWLDLADETFLIPYGVTGPQMFDHVVRRISERFQSPHIRRCDVGRDTLMGMVAAGDGITLTTEATTHIPFPGVVFRLIADETEPARFSAVWSPHNRSPALKNLLNMAIEMSQSA